MYRTAILFKLLLVSLLYTMCGTVSKDFIPQKLLLEACLHFEEMFPEKCEKARKAALNTQTSETTIKVPLTTSTSATTTEAPVLTTTTSETTTSVPITSEVTTTGTTTSASTADPSTTQTSATTTTAPVTTPTSETTTSAITPAAGTTEEKTARTSVSTSAVGTTTPRCLVTEGMDNPTVIPTDYLQQKPNFPSSDDVEKLRPGDEPFTINPSDTPINVTLKVSDEPVDLSEMKVLGTNVKEFKVFARRTPDGPLGLLTPVDPDSSDVSLTFLLGTLVTSVVVEVTPETGIEPVTLDVSLHACFEVTTAASTTQTSETTSTGPLTTSKSATTTTAPLTTQTSEVTTTETTTAVSTTDPSTTQTSATTTTAPVTTTTSETTTSVDQNTQTSETTTTDPCTPNPCHGGGTCKVVNNRFQCDCPTGLFGNRCELCQGNCSSRYFCRPPRKIIENVSGCDAPICCFSD